MDNIPFLLTTVFYALTAILIFVSVALLLRLLFPGLTDWTSETSFHNGSLTVSSVWHEIAGQNDKIVMEFLAPGLYEIKFENLSTREVDQYLPAGFTVSIPEGATPQKRILSQKQMPKKINMTVIAFGKEETQEI